MSMVRALRTLNALENGTLDATGLQTQLASASRLAELNILLNTRSLYDRICASAPTMNAIMGSALAQTAATQVRYWQEWLTAIASYPASKSALHGSDTVLSWIAASLARCNVLRSARSYAVTSVNMNGTTPVNLSTLSGTKYILLGLSYGAASVTTFTINTKRSGSSISNVASSDSTSDANAADSPLAIPLVWPYTALTQAGMFNVGFFGLLRCDA